MAARGRHTRVADQLRAAIVAGDLPVGTWLREVEIATQSGVSRAPVREALRALERDGLVVSYPNRGVQVIGVDVREAIELFTPMRVTVETFAARRICGPAFESGRAGVVAALEAAISEGDATARTGDPAAFVAADLAFHGAICGACDHPITTQLWQLVEPRIHLIFRARYTGSAQERGAAAAEMIGRHREIVAALAQGDGELAVALLNAHIVRGMRLASAGLPRAADGTE